MKIYTKKGDHGITSLYGGHKTEKSDVRIHAYGTVDELNSVIGMVLSYSISDKAKKMLSTIQDDLFVVGADLATIDPKKAKIDQVNDSQVTQLEEWIDELEEELSPLKSFILPGGTGAGSSLHFARTVCRRAERITVELSQHDSINPKNIIYLNRLSDFLFVLARYENREAGVEETPWNPSKR